MAKKTSKSNSVSKYNKKISNKSPSISKAKQAVYEGGYPYWYGPSTAFIVKSTYHDVPFDRMVFDFEYKTLLSRAREIYSNVGSVKNAIHEIADQAVGLGWDWNYVGPDKKWGEEAKELLQQWEKIADVRGAPYTFNMGLRLASIASDRDGDCLMVLTENEEHWPQIQWIGGHAIASRGPSGELVYEANDSRWSKGVLFDGRGYPISYHVIGDRDNAEYDYEISSRDAQLVYSPEYHDASRGITALASAIIPWANYQDILKFESIGIKAASRQALQYYVPAEMIPDVSGEYDDSPYARKMQVPGTAATRSLAVEYMENSEVQIFRADSGAELKVLESKRPSAETSNFLMDHLLRHCFASLRWPIELSFNLDSAGATTKLLVAKAQRRIEYTQTQVLRPAWYRATCYAIAKFMKYGYLRKSEDWYQWKPNYPQEFVLENYKDVKSDLELVNRGIVSPIELASQYGNNIFKNIDDKATVLEYAKKVAEEKGIDSNELIQTATQTVKQVGTSDDKGSDSTEPKDKQSQEDENE